MTALLLVAFFAGFPGITMDIGEPLPVTGSSVHLVRTGGYRDPWRDASVLKTPLTRENPPPHYFPVDTLTLQTIIPAKGEAVVRMGYNEAQLFPHQHIQLTDQALETLDLVPDWMRLDLLWNYCLLSAANQDRYAGLLLEHQGQQWFDEMAFTVAHTSWTILADPNWDETLLVNNAQWLYIIDQDLSFVTIRDYPGSGYYSTTEYTVIENGDTVLVEIPREIYYWYIVMPRLSDEKPLQDASVYDTFWREYIYTTNDAGYPIMQEIMAPITVFYDGLQYNWPGSRPFTDNMMAVDAIGKWCSATVHGPPGSPRPIQPNRILHVHGGYCGEMQDILAAAARTILIPAVSTMNILEDHVWCQTWWQGQWIPWQVELGGNMTQINNPGIAYDFTHGGSKECSCIWSWRNDGFTWDDAAMYTQTCTLLVTVTDSLGIPVDNAKVTVASEVWQGTTVQRGTWGETDRNGQIQFILGDNQNYYLSIGTTLGNFGSGGYEAIIENSVPGQFYTFEWSPALPMPLLEYAVEPQGTGRRFLMHVQYSMPLDLMNGRDHFATPRNEYSQPMENGSTDFFAVDLPNYQLYLDGEPFVCHEPAMHSGEGDFWFCIPHDRDYYLVWSGKRRHGAATAGDITVTLYQHDGTGIAVEPQLSGRVNCAPNPLYSTAQIGFSTGDAGEASVWVFSLDGRLVQTIHRGILDQGTHSFSWDASEVPSGVYFLRVTAPGVDHSGRMVVTR